MKTYNTHRNDMLTSLGISEYLSAILQIPLEEGKPAYNGRTSHEVCVNAQKFARYRSLCYKEKSLRLKLTELTTELVRAEKTGIPVPYMQRKRVQLREMTLELSRITLKRRDLEALRDSITNDFTAKVVEHRYFASPERRLPTWQQTAKELGIPVSGEELRRHICEELRKL